MKYIIYCRKSSEDEAHQAQSLETQMSLLDDYAKRCDLVVVDRLEESKSAKNDNHRPLFNLMIEKIKNGEIDGILVAHIDRLSRNGMESALIIKLFEQGFLKEIRTPSKIYSSLQDLLYMDFDFVFASHYSRNLSIRVKEGIQTKLKKGEFPNQAPIGYLNDNGKIYPDPDRVFYIKRVYELYTSGNYSLKALCQKLDDEGFRSTKGTKIRKSSIEHILKNPVYMGEILNKGKIYQGIHKPIISKDSYQKAQDVIHNKTRPKPKKYDFLYRGFVKCAVCGCMFTTSLKTKPSLKQYIYYYCTNGKFVCNQHKSYLRDDKVADLAQSIFDNLSEIVSSEIATLSLEAYCQSLKSETEYGDKIQKNLDNLISKNKENKVSLSISY